MDVVIQPVYYINGADHVAFEISFNVSLLYISLFAQIDEVSNH